MIWKAPKQSNRKVQREGSGVTRPPREPSAVPGCQPANPPRGQQARPRGEWVLLTSAGATHVSPEQVAPRAGSVLPHVGQGQACRVLGLSACTGTHMEGREACDSLDFTTDYFKIIRSSFKIWKECLIQRHRASRLQKQIHMCCVDPESCHIEELVSLKIMGRLFAGQAGHACSDLIVRGNSLK